VPYLGPYNAAKAALVSLGQSLRLELAHTPIRVIDLQPANINTNFQAATRRIETTLDQDRVAAAWRSLDADMAAAPPPQLVARAILKIINSPNPPPVVTVGSFFQAHLGPLIARFGSARINEWVLRRYYKI
jgi:NAD(P)-dependent dehydrogenase (short-subunit alcohol dehydrogenase family)